MQNASFRGNWVQRSRTMESTSPSKSILAKSISLPLMWLAPLMAIARTISLVTLVMRKRRPLTNPADTSRFLIKIAIAPGFNCNSWSGIPEGVSMWSSSGNVDFVNNSSALPFQKWIFWIIINHGVLAVQSLCLTRERCQDLKTQLEMRRNKLNAL